MQNLSLTRWLTLSGVLIHTSTQIFVAFSASLNAFNTSLSREKSLCVMFLTVVVERGDNTHHVYGQYLLHKKSPHCVYM